MAGTRAPALARDDCSPHGLGVVLPLPGYLLAALYWPAGVHDINSRQEGVVFVSFIVLVSAAI